MPYNVILPEPSPSFHCYYVICDCVTVMSCQTLTPVPRIENKREEEKIKIKIK